MKEALALAQLPLEGRHQRGEDDDAWNIAALVALLLERRQWPQQGQTVTPQ